MKVKFNNKLNYRQHMLENIKGGGGNARKQMAGSRKATNTNKQTINKSRTLTQKGKTGEKQGETQTGRIVISLLLLAGDTGVNR